MALKRIQKEMRDLGKNGPPEGVNCYPKDMDDLYKWEATILGPEGTPYEGGVFFVDIDIPKDYPYRSARYRMTTKIYHPNVTKAGCVYMGRDNHYCSNCCLQDHWSPAMRIITIISEIRLVISDPNPHSEEMAYYAINEEER